MKKGLILSWVLVLALTAVSLVLERRVVRLNDRLGAVQAQLAATAEKTPDTAQDEEAEGESETSPVTNASPQMAVVKTTYDGKTSLCVQLSEPVDMESFSRHVTVGPLAEGRPTFENASYYSAREGRSVVRLRIGGEFAFRTNVTLRIRKGLPIFVRGRAPSAEGALKEDFVYTFRRPDRDPYVAYVADGRYLPPGGKRAIEIETMNVTNVHVAVRRVEPRNVVQMLAREEGEYGRCPDGCSADGDETEELAGEAMTNTLRCAGRANEKVVRPIEVGLRDGKPANGIYLLEVHNSDLAIRDWSWNGERLNPLRCRVVCVSDLGLSVRKSGADGLGVWVTSLTTGKPVDGAWVEVYSAANVKVMEGRTAANGLCRVKRVDKGEPFAVVVISAEADDMTFLALRESMTVDETQPDGTRPDYLKAGEVRAFVWTERGIYRHDERIFLQAILRDKNRKAPPSRPVEFVLRNPNGNDYARKTVVTDAEGAAACTAFAVPAEQPSGVWTIEAKVPGKDGRSLGRREVKIEEFAPPQVRVNVAADAAQHPSNFCFTVTAEHLFGGAAHGLTCEGAVVFEDVPFAPAGWKGWHFGNDDLGLRPCYRKVGKGLLDRSGACRFSAPLWASAGRPKAAVRVTGQGVVFEDGGRPATMRKSVVLDYYPYYIGSTLPSWLKLEAGRRPQMTLVCVDPAGRPIKESRRLTAKVERIDSVYSYKTQSDGWNSWNCEHVRTTVADGLAIRTVANGQTTVELPLSQCGDYAVTVVDEQTGASYGRSFYLSSWGDNVVRAPLANPTEVTIVPDKAFYRAGETPRLTVKAPFAGFAMMSVMREKEAYTEILALTNATSEVTLRPVTASNAPNLDVYLSVVQSVGANARHMAARAKGQTTVRVRPVEDEIPVAVKATVVDLKKVDVVIDAPGADFAVVTVVDEAINLLTGEATPDPVGHFAEPCGAEHPLYDLYHRILPVVGEHGLMRSGVKTGGGFGAEMLGRVSPTPTRRFRPLALWSEKVAVQDGEGWTSIALPEFVGEVRVTVVAYSRSATGAASVQKKVTPKLVMMPDAPRFVAPGDTFELTLPIYNRSEGEAKLGFEISSGGQTVARQSLVRLPKDGSTNVVARMRAADEPGEMALRFAVRGAGETHEQTICLPVRPAVAWVESAGVDRVKGEAVPRVRECVVTNRGERCWRKTYDSPIGELARSLEWLADYPHGCLEQTCSRIFPLIAAGGILASVGSDATSNRVAYVASGVRRVESMVRANDFVMWPDCTSAPWDREVSLYAAHFLVEAERAGQKLAPSARSRVMGFLSQWAISTNEAVSAYACHTLALARAPEKDRQLLLYDRRNRLSLLSRARLARAFMAVHDRPRAEELLKNAAAPSSVREAAFAVLALLEIDPDDGRILPLVAYLQSARDRRRFSWGTTEENAHALLAIGEYYRHHPPQAGEKFVAWRKLSLPPLAEVRDEAHGLGVSRRFLTPEGNPANTNDLRRGELLIAELSVTSEDSRWLGDLVVEDLFAGALEPVHGGMPIAVAPGTNEVAASQWVMRSDARDDRMLVFSKRFHLDRGQVATFRYPVRVVSAGEYVLPGPSVEAMYYPSLRAKRAPGRIRIER